MVSLKIEFNGHFRDNGMWSRILKVKMPLVDGTPVEAELIIDQLPGKARSVVMRLKEIAMHAGAVEARDGMLKTERREELGLLTTSCPLEHAESLMRTLFDELRLEAPDVTMEVTKRLDNLAMDGTVEPRRKWVVAPRIVEPEIDFGKYLLMQPNGSEIAGIIGWGFSDLEHKIEHFGIWQTHINTENLGGGFIRLASDRIYLTGESKTYKQPSFDLVYDAALGLVQALKSCRQITTFRAQLEGLERYPLTF